MKSLVLTALATILAGCIHLHSPPPQTPVDLGKAVACLGQELENGVTDPGTAALACLPSDIPLATDLWKTLTGAKAAGQSIGAAQCTGSAKTK